MVYFGGFFAKLGHFAGFSSIIEAAMCGEHNIYIWVPRSPFIRDGEIEEGGCEETFLCLSLNCEACRFTVPSAVALLNFTSCSILWRIFCQTVMGRGRGRGT